MRMILLALSLIVVACQSAEEQPRERIPTVGPHGYYKELKDPDCPNDPTCVCGLPEDQRPEHLTDPATGERREFVCS